MMGPDDDVLRPQAPSRTAFLLIGPNIISWCIQLIMYGFSLSMFMQYRVTTLWDDISPRLRTLMTVVVALNTISTGLNFQEIVHYGTSQKRDYVGLAGWTLADCFPALSGLIRHRPLKLALTPLFVVSIAIAFIGSVGNSICGFYYYMNKPEQLGGFQINVTMAMYSTATAFCDILVTAALYFTLSREIRGFSRKTDGILRYMIWLSLRTAAYTAIFAFVGAVLSLRYTFTSDEGTLCFLFLFCLPSLSTLSLFTTIDGTQTLRAANRPVGPSSSGTRFTFGGFRRPTELGTKTEVEGRNAVSVKLETVKVVDAESGMTATGTGTAERASRNSEDEKMV